MATRFSSPHSIARMFSCLVDTMLTFDTMSERAQVPAAAQPLYDVMGKARCGGCMLSGCWSVSDLPNACKRAACPARHRRGPRAESGTECPARSAYCISHVCIWSALADMVPCPCASCLARSGLRFRFAASWPGGVTRRAEDTIALDWECPPVSSCTCFPRVAQGSTTEAPGWCRCACPARRASRRHGIVRASKGASAGASAGWQELHAAAKFGPWNGLMRSTGQI